MAIQRKNVSNEMRIYDTFVSMAGNTGRMIQVITFVL